VRDSVACIIGAYHSSSFPAHWAPYAKLLCHKDKQIIFDIAKTIVCLQKRAREWDATRLLFLTLYLAL